MFFLMCFEVNKTENETIIDTCDVLRTNVPSLTTINTRHGIEIGT